MKYSISKCLKLSIAEQRMIIINRHNKFTPALREAILNFKRLGLDTVNKCLGGVPLIIGKCRDYELIVRGYLKVGHSLSINIQEKSSQSNPMLIKGFNITESLYRKKDAEDAKRLVLEFLGDLLKNNEILESLGYQSTSFNRNVRAFSDGRKLIEYLCDSKELTIHFKKEDEIVDEEMPYLTRYKDSSEILSIMLACEKSHLCLESIATMNSRLKELIMKGEAE